MLQKFKPFQEVVHVKFTDLIPNIHPQLFALPYFAVLCEVLTLKTMIDYQAWYVGEI